MKLQELLIDPQQARARLIDALGLSEFANDEQDSVIEQVVEVILDQLMVLILAHIPQEEHPKLEKLLEAQQLDAVQAHIHKYVPNLTELTDAVFEVGIEEYKRIASQELQKK